jgi:hypothetical protein
MRQHPFHLPGLLCTSETGQVQGNLRVLEFPLTSGLLGAMRQPGTFPESTTSKGVGMKNHLSLLRVYAVVVVLF